MVTLDLLLSVTGGTLIAGQRVGWPWEPLLSHYKTWNRIYSVHKWLLHKCSTKIKTAWAILEFMLAAPLLTLLFTGSLNNVESRTENPEDCKFIAVWYQHRSLEAKLKHFRGLLPLHSELIEPCHVYSSLDSVCIRPEGRNLFAGEPSAPSGPSGGSHVQSVSPCRFLSGSSRVWRAEICSSCTSSAKTPKLSGKESRSLAG